jgi:predicted RecB family nuclease
MQPNRNILYAMLRCHYKAWQISRSEDEQQNIHPYLSADTPINIPDNFITTTGKLILEVLYYGKTEKTSSFVQEIILGNGQNITVRIRPNSIKAQKLFADTQKIINNDSPPAFYRNAHCPECQFQEACYKKLKERDCISLLSGMPSKVILKFQKKGFYSVAQLSHLFRPRRRRQHPQAPTNYLWELKALAITEQKTFVLCPPDIKESSIAIYLDMEGIPDENRIYLIGVLIVEQGQENKTHSFWADKAENEKEIFADVFALLKQYPEVPIYHYGSYETRSLKQAQKKWPALKNEINNVESQMINLLSILRTHVYPPIYSNGLKDLAHFLGFKWAMDNATGLLSVQWRKGWESSNEILIKEHLLQYNLDDCRALLIVKQWFSHLATDTEHKDIQQVAAMKKQSMFKFQNNPELGTDFQYISKAAYFDYQRSKIYWRNKNAISNAVIKEQKPKSQKGIMVWQPRKVHEVIMLPPLNACPKCGAIKVYQYKKKVKLVQTDLKFTATGIKQYVVEYQGTRSKCSKCFSQYNDHNFRRFQYGDNVFVYATNLYLRYNISNYMISQIMQEQFGIWINPMYLVMRKQKWWQSWQPEVDYIWQIIRYSPVIHIDETSIKLKNKNGHVWVFATTHTVLYHYTDTREGNFLLDWLKQYTGVIITDFFASYEALPVNRQKCLIHLIRDLNDDLFKNPFDEEYKGMVIGFNTLLRKIIDTVDRYGLKKIHLQKHFSDTEKFFHQFIECTYKSELANKCSKRFQKHWGQLWAFLKSDGVPWNNNNAEAAVKAFAQYRRGVKGMIAEKGLREYLKILSIAQTCRYRNIKFLSFLRRKSGLWENIPPEALPGYLPFNQARQFAQKLKFQKREEWLEWARTNKRPSFIPLTPDRFYKDKGWVSWADWLGTGFWLFTKARTYMRKLGLKNREEYRQWLKSGKRPNTIPHEPENVYKHTGWQGLGDWLGTGNIQNQKKKKLSYEQTKTYIQAIGIRSWQEYMNWSVSGERPLNIPAAPDKAYFEFEGWGKFLGTDRVANQNKEFWGYEEAKKFIATLNIRSKSQFIALCKNDSLPGEIPRDPAVHYKRKKVWKSYNDFFGK